MVARSLSTNYSRQGVAWAVLCALVCGPLGDAWAIQVNPTTEEIESALEEGKAAAAARTPPDRLYAWFGPRHEVEPHGFIMTKITGLAVMSTHFALRGETPNQAEIDRILDDPSLVISAVIYGDRPDFAVDSYLLVMQRDRTITPTTVRFDGQAARSAAWPGRPAYRAKLVASVPYVDLDPIARTRISIFPGSGGEITFDLDFAQIN